MEICFAGPAVLVADVAVSRRFYETVLGQAVLADHGPHVAFVGGFSIWLADHASEVVLGRPRSESGPLGADNLELYFESADLDGAYAAVRAAMSDEAVLVHPIRVQPWLQRSFRLRDPDGHLVEVGEPLALLVKRLLADGLTAEEVSARTSIPLDGVRAMSGGVERLQEIPGADRP